MNAANRDRLIAAQQAAGVPYSNVTHVTHNHDNSTHNTLYHQDIHNEAMAMLQNHSAQFGAYMHQHRMSQEAMLHLLFERIRANRAEPELHITMLGGSGPPPPPGTGGVVRKRRVTGKQTPYDRGVEAVAESGKPPPPPPPAPEAVLLGNAPRHMAAIADAPQQMRHAGEARAEARLPLVRAQN